MQESKHLLSLDWTLAEWQALYQELFHGDFSSQNHAIKRLSVWKCRSQQKLPTAVELTWQLMSSYHQDLLYQEHTGDLQHEQVIRMTYAMALIRFVNLLTEKNQKGQYALSVTSLAREMGLPDWLVDIRHDSTHAHMPSLPVLRKACEISLAWLKSEYWEMELKNSAEVNAESQAQFMTDPRRVLADVLDDYLQLQIQVIDRKERHMNGILKPVLNRLAALLADHKQDMIDILVSEGYLIPTLEQMDFLEIKEQDVTSSTPEELPLNLLVQMWQPVLQLLHKDGLVLKLIQALILNLHHQRAPQGKIAIAWIYNIIKACRFSGFSRGSSEDKSNQLKFRPAQQLDGRSLLNLALEKPCVFTAELLPCLYGIIVPALSIQQETQLLQLVKAYVGSKAGKGSSKGLDSIRNIKTLTDLYKNTEDELQRVRQSENHIQPGSLSCNFGENSMTNRKWKLDEGLVDWSLYPLGYCPGQELDYTSLELPAWLDKLLVSTVASDGNASVQDRRHEEVPRGTGVQGLGRSVQHDRMELSDDVDSRNMDDPCSSDIHVAKSMMPASSGSAWTKDQLKQIIDKVTLF